VFVDRDRFLEHVDRGGFLEHAAVVDGHLYGTPVPDPPPDKDVVLEIDIQGAQQVLAQDPNTIVILVLAPSRGAHEARLRGRGDDEAHVQRRLEMAGQEERVGRDLAHHIVVNDDLERAVAEVAAILEGRRQHRA
jgi:guanylate kinase